MLLLHTYVCTSPTGIITHVNHVLSIVSSVLQDGAAGDECLSGVAATDDGGVVVGGHLNGTYDGVASEGLVDFAAIKLGESVKRLGSFRAHALHPGRARPERRHTSTANHVAMNNRMYVLPVCSTPSPHPLSHTPNPLLPSLGYL